MIALSEQVSLDAAVSLLSEAAGEDQSPPPLPEPLSRAHSIGPLTLRVPRYKARLSLLPAGGPDRDLIAVLDALKVADVVLIVAAAGVVADEKAQALMAAMRAQGVPTVVGALQGLPHLPPKHHLKAKRAAHEWFEHEFSTGPKVLPLDSVEEGGGLLRVLAEVHVEQLHWRSVRPYLVADRVHWEPHGEGAAWGTLHVSGYLRGGPLAANSLVHVTGYGEAQLLRVAGGFDPYAFKKPHPGDQPMLSVLAESDQPTDLARENEVDPFAAEQTWPTEEELREAQGSLPPLPCPSLHSL